MGWNPTDDWSALSHVRQYIEALNERYAAAYNSGGLALPQVDWDVQLGHECLYGYWDPPETVNWHYVQTDVEDLVPYFVEKRDWEGAADIPWLTVERWRQVVGLHPDGWTRYRTHPSQGGQPLHGAMQYGDIIGPWVFDELRRGLNALVWTLVNADWEHTASSHTYMQHTTSWSACVDAAIAAWDSPGANMDGPGGYTSGYLYQDNQYPYPNHWYAEAGRRNDKARTSGTIPTCNGTLSHQAFFFAKLCRDNNWYNYLNDWPENVYKSWCSNSVSTASEELSSSTLGSSTAAIPKDKWCAAPNPSSRQGCGASRPLVILKWDVGGGLQYR